MTVGSRLSHKGWKYTRYAYLSYQTSPVVYINEIQLG